MKKLTLLLFVFMAFDAFSQGADRGGQGGSGGNGCYISTSHGPVWRPLEDVISSPDSYEQEGMESPFPGVFADNLEIKKRDFIFKKDLSKFISFKNAQSRIKSLSNTLPRISKALVDFFAFFEHTYVLQYKIRGIYNGNEGRTRWTCTNYFPVFLTDFNGSLVISRPVWNSLDPIFKEFILVHEVLRFAQMFHPAFRGFTDTDLQKVTKLIMGDAPQYQIRRILDEIEIKIGRSPGYFSYGSPYWYAQDIFEKKMSSCSANGISPKNCLNELHKDEAYLELIMQEIRII